MHIVTIIDASVPDPRTLIAGLSGDAEVLLLNAEDDGADQIADFLAHRSEIDALHIISHGAPGAVQLGGSLLTAETLRASTAIWDQIGKSLSADADILLYGCNVAQGQTGQTFLDQLARITNADVGASTDATGTASLGGNWVLEARTGPLDATPDVTVEDWRHLLPMVSAPLAASFPGHTSGEWINRIAFAALKADGSVVTWGEDGGDSSAVAANLASGVRQIFSTYDAFAALKDDGSVVTWGFSPCGGDSSAVAADLASGVRQIFSTYDAFAALKADGSVVTWGIGFHGGDSSAVAADLASGVRQIFSTSDAFAALKDDGSVVTWGSDFNGGNSSAVAADLSSGVLQVFSSGYAFAALKDDGSVVTWGDASGVDSSAVAGALASGVRQIFSTYTAFAALKDDGSVVTWGSNLCGGDSSAVAANLASGVRQIFSNGYAFAALKDDGGVVTWGVASYGGDSSAVQSQLVNVVGMANIHTDDNYIPFISEVRGAAGNDRLVGSGDRERIYGLAGHDTIQGSGNDTLYGGTGNDTYIVRAGDNVKEVSTVATEIDKVQSSVTWTLGANLENLVLAGASAINGSGNALANRLTGNGAANALNGLAGNDTLIGNAGNDTLNGGLGADSMAGGLGNDVYAIDNAGDTTIELAGQGVDTVQSSRTWTLAANLENLTLRGTVAINGIGNVASNRLVGNSAANTLFGYAGNDTLAGGAGNDILNGGAGLDSMTGGVGNDIYVVENAGDKIIELASQGVDTVQSSRTWTLGANLENLTLTGTAAINGTGNAAANRLTGNSAANTLLGGAGNDTLTGGAGNDILNGGAGLDSMTGGVGNDIYVVDNAGDKNIELANQGLDTVQSSLTWTLGANLESLTLTGTAAINGTGNAAANRLTGNNAANTLFGYAGNDTLTGGAGNDILNGGAGLDSMTGGWGNDIYVVDNAGDKTIELANQGVDTVQSSRTWTLGANLENLALTGTAAINGTGNALNNRLTGNGAANVLNGLAGNDTLVGNAGNDTLIGGAGADVLQGGAGNDNLNGGLGNDTLTGGLGTDRFVFNTALGASNVDRITDFAHGVDKIVLDDDVFTGLTVGTLGAIRFRKGAGVTTAGDADDRLVLNTTTGALYYDANGSAAGAAVQIAVVQGAGMTAMTAADFLVVA